MIARPRILVAIPVLQRPANAQPVIDSLTESDANVRAVFVCSPGDRQQIAACEKTGTETLVTTHPPIKGDFAHKMNLAYRESSEPWIFQAADDIRFEAGWDKALLRTAKETGAKVIGTQDGGNPSVKRGIHSTHTLIARSYIDDPGASMDGPGSVFSYRVRAPVLRCGVGRARDGAWRVGVLRRRLRPARSSVLAARWTRAVGRDVSQGAGDRAGRSADVPATPADVGDDEAAVRIVGSEYLQPLARAEAALEYAARLKEGHSGTISREEARAPERVRTLAETSRPGALTH